MTFCITVIFFSWETEFAHIVGEETSAARSRHTSRRRRIPISVSPRHRARCNHEARAGTVTQTSCCLVRCVPLAFTVMTSAAQQSTVFRCAQRITHYRSRTCQIFMRPTDEILLRQPQRTSSSLPSVSPLARQLYRCSVGFAHARRMIFAILRTPTRMVTTPTTVAYLYSQNVTLQLGLHVASSLDPRLASGAFAVAKDEGRDRFLETDAR